MPSVTSLDLLSLLGSGEPVPAARLVQQLGVSRPVLGRLVREAGTHVLRIGKARATAYAARTATDAGSAWPLWRMRADATLDELGTLHALRGERFQFEPAGERPNLMRAVEHVAGHFSGLPWFLDDLRPQGFLGRTLAHQQAQRLGVPEDLNRWQLRDTLLAITRSGGTGIGDLLLGRMAVEHALAEHEAPSDAVAASERPVRYAQWAQAALAGEDVGSSPGGEQPKFTATVTTDTTRYAALVKFAVPDSGEAARRWADLLACEHIALSCLRDADLPASESELIDAAGYTFLEVRRFDRTTNVLGRRGYVSLLALSDAFIGDDLRDWSLSADRLAAAGLIDSDAVTQMARLHWFGRLIGNSDMHAGNLGFHLVDSGPLALTPAYDMLPMSLAPSRTGAVRAAVPIQPGVPDRIGQLEHVGWAAEVAGRFWQQVADSEHIQSDELRRLALRNRDVVARHARVVGR
ncbi:type II toxin-antitoxin system HipA family toxin YjjJ [Xanthomonadaceae bacterium XH05]|nr:type II toxin-antitoxin system HipA family toxin YjjJ [Xanthomonadaceae bacterium XH05]